MGPEGFGGTRQRIPPLGRFFHPPYGLATMAHSRGGRGNESPRRGAGLALLPDSTCDSGGPLSCAEARLYRTLSCLGIHQWSDSEHGLPTHTTPLRGLGIGASRLGGGGPPHLQSSSPIPRLEMRSSLSAEPATGDGNTRTQQNALYEGCGSAPRASATGASADPSHWHPSLPSPSARTERDCPHDTPLIRACCLTASSQAV
jgi:hypothetical protein